MKNNYKPTPRKKDADARMLNPFIGSSGDWHLNACVGGNTGSNDNSIGYAEGFKTAAEIMLRLLGVVRPAKADESWGEYPLIDTLVYPICYSARHHIELALKRALPKAWRIFKARSPGDSCGLVSETTHSVIKVWTNLHAICSRAADDRLIVLVERIKPYTLAMEDIDKTGQVFRYACDAEDGRPHLSGISHINLQIFSEWYVELCELLEDLELLLDSLAFEYSTGSFTSKLTREQLVEIAKRLPSRDEWTSDTFTIARKKIRADYALSSNDFQKACDIIQKTRALAHYINISIPIDGLKHDTFQRLHRASNANNSTSASLDINERSIIFGLLTIGEPIVYPEQFELYLTPRPSNDQDAHQFDLERDLAYLARKASKRPDLIERALLSLGQNQVLSDFRSTFHEEIKSLSAHRERSRNINFNEFFGHEPE